MYLCSSFLRKEFTSKYILNYMYIKPQHNHFVVFGREHLSMYYVT